MAKDVVIIQQTTQTQQERKRVAAYARVSCGKDTMLHSLAAQIDYYRKLISRVCPKFCVNSKSQCKIEQKLLFWGVSPLSTL